MIDLKILILIIKMIRILLKIIEALKRIKVQAEEVKIKLSQSVECLFDIANFYDGNDLLHVENKIIISKKCII